TPTPVPSPPPAEAVAATLTPTPTVIPTPTPTPAVATGTQAELRVWLAVRDCFVPPPAPERFRAYQDRADRWIVEGRMEPDRTNRQDEDETIFFGLWLVDRDTGRITPHDALARRTRDNRFCFAEP
ncbi:MAG TPA: hypothetical protein VFR55_10735, partial [Dehalococcoidia bacterium]|nr:hypothetical protein [Dehalococcoidia bacterium]